MTVHYCPGCWAEMSNMRHTCRACGRPLVADEGFVEKLLTALRHPEPTRAQLAIHVLSEMMAESRAILPLIDLLGTTDDAAVLRDAVVALASLADQRGASAIGRLLVNPGTPLVVRIAAVEALGQLGGSEAEAALERALADPTGAVR